MNRNVGISGYTGYKTLYSKRRPNRRRINRVRKFNKRVEKAVTDRLCEKANYHVIQNLRIAVPVGTQQYSVPLVQNSYADLNAIYGKITTPPAGITSPGTAGTAKYTITSYYCNMLMKNQSNVSCIVDLYLIIPRIDQTATLTTTFSVGMSDQSDSGADLLYGVTPYQCNRFCTLNVIKQKKRYVLAPGATQCIEYTDKRNYEIQNERINYNGGTTVSFKGLTKSWLAIVRGEPENDSTTKTLVSVAPTAVDFITNETYYYTYTPLMMSYTNHSNNLGVITTGSSVLIDTGATVVPINS